MLVWVIIVVAIIIVVIIIVIIWPVVLSSVSQLFFRLSEKESTETQDLCHKTWRQSSSSSLSSRASEVPTCSEEYLLFFLWHTWLKWIDFVSKACKWMSLQWRTLSFSTSSDRALWGGICTLWHVYKRQVTATAVVNPLNLPPLLPSNPINCLPPQSSFESVHFV